MKALALLKALGGDTVELAVEDLVLRGQFGFEGRTLAVVGTVEHAPIGVARALAQARAVLDTVREHLGRPILLLVDTQGQQLRRRDEMLGIHRAMAHLGKAVDLARRLGHPVVGLVYDQALSGGFLTSGLMADVCDALAEAEIRVMRLPAMARVTKLPEARLAELSRDNPVFAPGVANYVAMGGVRALWPGEDLAAGLRGALAASGQPDRRALDGAQRGGRKLAAAVMQQVRDAA